jgi:hypothetical protein
LNILDRALRSHRSWVSTAKLVEFFAAPTHRLAIAVSFVALGKSTGSYFTNVVVLDQNSDNRLLVIWENSGLSLRDRAYAGRNKKRQGHGNRSLSV